MSDYNSIYTGAEIDAGIGKANNAVPTSRTVNGKALSTDISLAATDVGAVPTSRTVNGQALSADITLTAANVGAAGSTHTHAASDITSGVTNNTNTSGSLNGSANLITMNTLRFAINRTSSVAVGDTNYSTYMARGSSLVSAETTPTYNGAIAWTYE